MIRSEEHFPKIDVYKNFVEDDKDVIDQSY